MIVTFTHLSDRLGKCQLCRCDLQAHNKTARFGHGERIGMIESKYGGTVVYRTGKNDSNPHCPGLLPVV